MITSRLWKYIREKVPLNVQVFAIVVIVLFAIEMFMLWNGKSDYALQVIRDGGMPMPYGILWTWLNPLWWTNIEYKIYLTIFISATTLLSWWMVIHKKFPFQVAFWSMLQNILWLILGGFQQITTNTFLTFSFWNPVFIPLWFLQKLPLGWSWGITDNPSWQCNFGDEKVFFTGPDGLDYQVCGRIFFGTPGHIAWHALQISWLVASIVYWTWRWRGLFTRKTLFRVLNSLRLVGPILRVMRATGLYERRVVKILRELKGEIFVDIGSNHGFYCDLLRKNFKQVFPIDPNPKYDAIHVAFSDHRGIETFYLNSNEGSGDGLLKDFGFRGETYQARKSFDVRVERFDRFFPRADLVKIDVEGAEFEVLKGMEGSDVDSIMIELHDLSRTGELILLLASRGYLVKRVDKDHFWFWRL